MCFLKYRITGDVYDWFSLLLFYSVQLLNVFCYVDYLVTTRKGLNLTTVCLLSKAVFLNRVCVQLKIRFVAVDFSSSC